MDAVRASLTLPSGEANAKPQRVSDAKIFWEGLVRAVSCAWKTTDVSLPRLLN